MPAFDDDVWELYDGNTDWTQSKDLSKENPEKLHELQRLWLIEAVKYNVLPLDDRQAERFIPDIAGRPTADQGQHPIARREAWAACRRTAWWTSRTSPGPSRPSWRSLMVGAEGVIIAQGGRFGGWSLYAKDGRAKFYYNVLGIKSFDIDGVRADSVGAPPRYEWSSPTTEAEWARAAP